MQFRQQKLEFGIECKDPAVADLLRQLAAKDQHRSLVTASQDRRLRFRADGRVGYLNRPQLLRNDMRNFSLGKRLRKEISMNLVRSLST